MDLAAQHATIKDKLLAAVGRVIDHGQFVLGQEVEEFEERFAALCNTRFAVTVNSGTDALIIALEALGVGPGDEVITVPNSFIASASCITAVGARPVFVDVGEDYNIDPALIEPAISSRTRAILPVHITGRPADMEAVMTVAKVHGLFVVEDCAQAVCAEFRGQQVGSFGEVGCFSLHPLKTLNACGDGGVLTTNDPSLYQQFRLLRNHGLRTRDDGVTWGRNSRLDTIQAAILLAKLDYLEEWTEGRRANAALYRAKLADVAEVDAPEDRSYEKSVYHTFVVQADRRDSLQSYLKENSVGTGIHYPTPIHLQEAAASLGYGPGSFPVTEKQANRILSLPVFPELRPEQIDYVVECIKSFYKSNDGL